MTDLQVATAVIVFAMIAVAVFVVLIVVSVGQGLARKVDALGLRLEPVKQHVASADSPWCAECGVHLAQWDEKPCRPSPALQVSRSTT